VFGKLRTELKDLVERHLREDVVGEDGSVPHPFAGLDKAAVLQECRVFHDANYVKLHPKRCCQLITKLLYFLTQGDTFNGTDSMEVFFGVTKLFQSTDGNLRRMVYLFLKEVAATTDPSNLLIVTQSLVKDMFHETPLYRANSIRVLSRIVDDKMLGQVERYYKQVRSGGRCAGGKGGATGVVNYEPAAPSHPPLSFLCVPQRARNTSPSHPPFPPLPPPQALVDKDDHVSAAALSSSFNLFNNRPGSGDVIMRWSNEVQTVLNSAGGKGDMVAFHALSLLRTLKRTDRLAVSKVVQTLARAGMRSPLGLCLLIRYSASLLLTPDAPGATAQSALDFIEGCLRHKSEMVVYEAARALVVLPPTAGGGAVAGRDVNLPITVLHMFLSSPKPALRYAAVRTLNRMATFAPASVAKCNEDLECLIADTNKAIGTMAITTLLKTGSEANVERLVKQIASFMADVGSDELKVVVVTAVHELALRVPSKHRPVQALLSNALRDEGGFEFKKAVLDALLDMMEVIPESKTEGLFHCCEFIEDCEFTALATRVLHLLGKEGPALPAPQPAAFIRFIYNRVILENAAVRASAVSALAKFATRCEDLRPQIIPLLRRCTDDDDDEVRDRASLYLRLLGDAGAGASEAAASAAAAAVDPGVARSLTRGVLPVPMASLAKSLQLYQLRPAPGAFSFAALPHVEPPLGPGGLPHAPEAGGGYGYLSETRAAEAAVAASKIARAKDRLASSAAAAAAAAEAAGGGGGGGGAGRAGGGADTSAAEMLYKIPEFASFGAIFRSSPPLELTEKELEYLVTVQKHVFANHLVRRAARRAREKTAARYPPPLTHFLHPPPPPRAGVWLHHHQHRA
jgi:coatomer protein complex subunit gamma